MESHFKLERWLNQHDPLYIFVVTRSSQKVAYALAQGYKKRHNFRSFAFFPIDSQMQRSKETVGRNTNSIILQLSLWALRLGSLIMPQQTSIACLSLRVPNARYKMLPWLWGSWYKWELFITTSFDWFPVGRETRFCRSSTLAITIKVQSNLVENWPDFSLHLLFLFSWMCQSVKTHGLSLEQMCLLRHFENSRGMPE